VGARRQRRPTKLDDFERARWYLVRRWHVVAIAAIIGVAPNTVRAWRRRLLREQIHRQVERLAR
jgi:transposase-like protein